MKMLKPCLSPALLALLFLKGWISFAAPADLIKTKHQYKVTTEILLDGKVVSSPQFVVNANESTSIETKSENSDSVLKMMLIASDFKNARIEDGIDLKMAVEYKTKDHSFHGNPRVVVMPDKEGTIAISSDATDNLEMRIKAVRQ